jgi:hypothetical protein
MVAGFMESNSGVKDFHILDIYGNQSLYLFIGCNLFYQVNLMTQTRHRRAPFPPNLLPGQV